MWNRSILLPLVTVLGVAWTPGAWAHPAVAQDDAGANAPEYISRVTLQILPQFGWNSAEIAGMLQSQDVLGSIQAGMIPAGAVASDAKLPSGAVIVNADQCGGNLVTISVRAGSEGDAKASTGRILDNLHKLTSPQMELEQAQRQSAEDAVVETEKDFKEARAAFQAFIDRHSAIEPRTRLSVAVSELQRTEQELRDWQRKIAEMQARRDYLLARIKEEPLLAARDEAAPVPAGADLAEISAERDRLESELKGLRDEQKLSDAHPEVMKRMAALQDLDRKIAARGAAPQPRISSERKRLESNLRDVEEDLAIHTSRVAYGRQQLDQLTNETRELARQDAEWRELSDRLRDTERAYERARNDVMNMSRSRLPPGGVFRIVAGPEIES